MANYINNLGQIRVGVRGWVAQTTTSNVTDVDATAFITAASITDSTQISALNTLVNDLKTYGLWTKMKALYPFVGGSADSHKFNLKDPRDDNAAYRLVFSGGWTHSSNGAKPNGTTGYADSKYNPYINGQLNSAHISYYSRTNSSSSNAIDMGALSAAPGNYHHMHIRYTGDLMFGLLNTSSAVSVSNNISQGLFISSRINNTNVSLYRNNSNIGNVSLNSSTQPSNNIYIGAGNITNSPQQYSSKESSFISIGDGLIDTEEANFYISIQKFQTTLGRHVGTPYVSDPDAITFLMAAGITDGTQAAAINTLVIRMKADGVWTKMKAVYPFVGGNATSHKFNLKDSRDLDAAFRLVFYGGMTHTNLGMVSNYTTSYASTNLTPSTALSSFYSQHVSVYSQTSTATPANNINSIGEWQDGTRAMIMKVRNLSNVFSWEVGNSGVSVTNNDGRGFYLASTIANNSIKLYKDNTNVATNTSTFSGSLPSQVQPIGKNENKTFSFATIGDGLTDTDALNFYTAVQAYQTTLGRQVNIPVVSDTDAQSFLNAANITSFQQASAVNKLVVDLKAAGVWSKMKAIYPFVGGSAAQHRFNLKDPRTVNDAFYLNFIGGWTHGSTGALSNGTTGYANTYFNLQILNQNNTHLSLYNTNNYVPNSTNGSIDMGAYHEIGTTTSGAFIASEIATNLSRARLFFSPLDYSSSDNRGYYIVNSNATNTKYFINNTSVASSANSGIFPLIDKTIFIGALNGDSSTNGAYYFANGLYTFSSIGDGLTDTEATSLYTAVQTYQTTLGRSVNTPIYNNGLVLNLDAGNANSYPGTGTTWFDLASGNNGTLVNGPTYDTTNGGSIVFDGVNDFSGHPIINFGTSSVSWSFWIKPSRYVSTFESFIGQGMYNVNGGGMVVGSLRGDTKRIQFLITSDPQGVNSKSVILDNSYTINTWTNIIVTYNSSNRDLFLYINGVKQNATTNTTGNFGNTSISQNLSPTNTTGRMLSLCMYDESRTMGSFNGNMAITQIYFRSLSDIEVLNYFNSTRGRFGL